ncbi:MAG: glycerophosphodiester phosphodiesterase family protein [Bacteroidia bacterium]
MPGKKHIDIQGHRGARGLYPENTLPAFIEAVKLGVDTLEMDVVISKDHKVVVSHEAWMSADYCSRPDGLPIEKESELDYNLYKMTYAEIVKYDCGKRGNPEFPLQKAIPAHKPLLSEVITQVEAYTENNNLPRVKYNIEIKSEREEDGIFQPDPQTFTDLVLAEIKEHAILPRIILQSFDVRILQELEKKDPMIVISLLVENTDGLIANLERLGFKPDTYAPEFILVDDHLVKELRSKNIKLIPWTVNETADMKRLLDSEVDGIITDYPDRLINLLQREKKR